MTASLLKTDFETIRRLAHSLKGSGANYGFANLTDLGGELETAAIAQQAPLCELLISKYKKILDSIQVD